MTEIVAQLHEIQEGQVAQNRRQQLKAVLGQFVGQVVRLALQFLQMAIVLVKPLPVVGASLEFRIPRRSAMIASTRKAYSYIRFSTGEQTKGSSLKRQLELSRQWCKHNNIILDESYKDLGVSAFKGTNRTRGALSRFLSAIQQGDIQAGSILIVESLDRLSRQEIDEALDLFRSILKAGVEIVTLSPERHYTKTSLNDFYALMEMLFTAQRAREEQERKAERIASAWIHKRKDISAPLTSSCPAWLSINEKKTAFVQKPDAVKTVLLIYSLCLEGLGCKAITSYLNKHKIKAFGRKPVWNNFYVRKLLTTRAVLGEYQPHTKHKCKNQPIGEPVEGYYPAIIDERTFQKVQLAMRGRKRTGGRIGKHCRNLFSGLAKDARDRSNLQLFVRRNGTGLLVSSNARHKVGNASFNSFHYEVFERSFLMLASGLKPTDLLPARADDKASTQLQDVENELAKVQRRVLQLKNKIVEDVELSETLFDTMKDLHAKEKALKVRVTELQADLHRDSCAATLSDTKNLIQFLNEYADDELTAIRQRLRAKLRDLLEEVIVLVIAHNRQRVAVCDCRFKNGTRKPMIIATYWGRHLFTVCSEKPLKALGCDLTKDRIRVEKAIRPLLAGSSDLKPSDFAKLGELVGKVGKLSELVNKE